VEKTLGTCIIVTIPLGAHAAEQLARFDQALKIT
jgi:hypothetical protein